MAGSPLHYPLLFVKSIYPAILETGAAQTSEYLQLCCLRRSVHWQGMTIGALVSKETSRYRPWQTYRTKRPVHSQLSIDYILIPTHRYPVIYMLSLRDQEEPPSKLIYAEGSGIEPGDYRTVEVSPRNLLGGISQTTFTPSCSHRFDSPAGSLTEAFVPLRPDSDIRN